MTDIYVQRTQQWINSEYGYNPDTPDIGPVTVDGYTGWQTVNALLRALQYELGITNRADSFGPTTLAMLTAISPINNNTTNKNIIRIAQGAMYCKGYAGGDGYLAGTWDSTAIAGMQDLRTDIGLSAGNGDIEPKVFRALLNMDAFVLVSGGTSLVRSIQRSLNGRYLHRRDFFVIPSDGRYTGEMQTALIYAVQYELGLLDGVANGNFGPTTKAELASQANLTLGATDTTKYFVHLFQAALIVNGYSVSYDGNFGSGTQSQTSAFQGFVALPQSGAANVQTWGSLLVSYGDADRPGTGADCVSTLTPDRLTALRSAGYTHFGRYLTNTPDYGLDKCIKDGEIAAIYAAGGKLFPLFQTGGGNIDHFTSERGQEVGQEAASAAWAYRLPTNTIIYFSVDFDATDSQIINSVIPYFQAIPNGLGRMGRTYRIGVYGPRRVCHLLTNAGLVVSSFVSDMSAGYGSNKAQVLPANWAFDQIQTKFEGSGSGRVEIDKNVVSGQYDGISTRASAWGVGDDPEIPVQSNPSDWDTMYEEMFRDTFEHEGLAQQGVNLANKVYVKQVIEAMDPYITQLAADFNCRKALILTPMVHEALCINVLDDNKDLAVRAYYIAVAAGAPYNPDDDNADSSTGICQIFAKTAIRAWNLASVLGLVSGPTMDHTVWSDRWKMWDDLQDAQFNVKMAMLVMMAEAYYSLGIHPANTRDMTPSQVMRTCVLYNGTNTNAQIYGRNRMSQYYTICKWEESFR